MSYTIIKKLTPIEEILQEIPLNDQAFIQINRDRKEIKQIISGEDPRLLMIVGPCSAWPSSAVLEYAGRLKQIQTQVSDVMKIVMRVYIQKPRTTKGWTGPLNQPDPLSPPDLEAGLRYARRMMIEVINLGLPIAGEALFTHNTKGFIELLSWVAVGARSAEDQEHRIYASSIDCAVGLKNPTHGNLKVGINSVIAAQHPHVAAFDGFEVQTHGNPYAHLVLRGSNGSPNYSSQHLKEALEMLQAYEVKNPTVLIDASHDNCKFNGMKDAQYQPQVITQVLDNLAAHPELKSLVKGFMIESFIRAGSQPLQAPLELDGLSITDPCLGWESTEHCLLQLAERLRDE